MIVLGVLVVAAVVQIALLSLLSNCLRTSLTAIALGAHMIDMSDRTEAPEIWN